MTILFVNEDSLPLLSDFSPSNMFKMFCMPEINPTWSCYIILFIHCWIWLAKISLRIFASTLMGDIGLQFSYLSLSGFWYKVMLTSQDECEIIPFASVL